MSGAGNGKLEMVKLLVSHGADVNAFTWEDHYTPLMFAAIENNISFMERLVALGCSVNKKNKEQVKEPPHKIIHLKVYD